MLSDARLSVKLSFTCRHETRGRARITGDLVYENGRLLLIGTPAEERREDGTDRFRDFKYVLVLSSLDDVRSSP